MIVLDASGPVDFLLNLHPQAAAISARLDRPEESLHAPHIIDPEVFQAIRHRERRRVLSLARGRLALEDLADLRLTRYPLIPLIDRMWAMRQNVSGLDAAYVALAEVLDAPLVTTDRRLARTRGRSARIEAFP